MQKTLKWTPNPPIKRADYIMSSKAREQGQLGFRPTYQSEPKINMSSLMSDEYMRVWFKERSTYEKNLYSKEQIIKEEAKIKRRFVQRMMTYRKPTKNDILDLLKVKETGSQPTDYSTMKFKPPCYKTTKEKPLKQGTSFASPPLIPDKDSKHNKQQAKNKKKEQNESTDKEDAKAIVLCPVQEYPALEIPPQCSNLECFY